VNGAEIAAVYAFGERRRMKRNKYKQNEKKRDELFQNGSLPYYI
jgi:hypothetical protein